MVTLIAICRTSTNKGNVKGRFMSVNLFMTAKSSADYINTGLKTDSYTDLDVIFLSTKGYFPAFNHLRYIGRANDKYGRKLYKINGIKGLYEDLIPLDIGDLADGFVNDRAIITEEDCAKSKFSLVKHFTTEDYDDPRYELLFDTTLVLRDVQKDGGEHSEYDYYHANLYSISTPFSKLDEYGIFNGIIRSPFIKLISDLHLPITSLLKNELEKLFLFRDDIAPLCLHQIDSYLFDSVPVYVNMPLQISYEIYDEYMDIFDEENIDDIFLFYRQHLNEFIKNTQDKSKNISEPKSAKIDSIEKEIGGKSETSYLNIIQVLKDELLNRGLFENQSDLISYLSNSYSGYAGLSETNLREKFSKANKIKLS